MKIKNKIIFLIPAKNEEKDIKNVILKFKKYGKPIVVNDHSSDKTLSISKKYAFKVLNLKKYNGYDAALKFGLKYIINNVSGSHVISVDADGEHSPSSLSKFIKKSKNSKLIIGNRYKYNRWAEYFVSFFSYIFFSIKDPLCGMKCYDLNYLRENKNFFLNKIDLNENNCGMFFFKIYDLKKISNLDIRTNNINRKSKFGSGLVVNLKLIKFFFDSII